MILKIRTSICLLGEIKNFNCLMIYTNDRTVALPSSMAEGALEKRNSSDDFANQNHTCTMPVPNARMTCNYGNSAPLPYQVEFRLQNMCSRSVVGNKPSNRHLNFLAMGKKFLSLMNFPTLQKPTEHSHPYSSASGIPY